MTGADLSHGEYRALVAKALRGAGYSWGLTEDGSHAVKWLEERGVSTGDLVVRLLHAVDGQPITDLMPDENWQSSGNALCPIRVGTCIMDAAGPPRQTGPVIEPMLLTPFLGARPAAGGGWTIRWDSGSIDVTPAGLVVTGTNPDEPVPLSIDPFSPTEPAGPCHGRVTINAATLTALEAFAHRTYAPATDASRAGAGAGTSDND